MRQKKQISKRFLRQLVKDEMKMKKYTRKAKNGYVLGWLLKHRTDDRDGRKAKQSGRASV